MKNHKLIYASSYDRGLIHLLKMWADIKEEVPDATLDIAYGWDLFLVGYANNPERMAWKKKVEELMTQEGITHHGRISKKALSELRKQCGIWAYPTDFDEINCITALEMQNDGVVPCVINRAALAETVQSGIKVDGDIYMREIKDQYKAALLILMSDTAQWEKESKKARAFAKSYSWDGIAKQWESHF
jgi:glycosyltransferase involved in cell wall biosynthesis